MFKPSWQTTCRQQAEAQALTEASQTWQIEPSDSLPFNYRWEHVQAVVRLALWLAYQLGGDIEIIEAAAWLHDVRKGVPQHALHGAEAAAQILPTTNFPAHKIAAVAAAIRQHEGLFRPPNAAPLQPLETAILWDADKLSKIGVQAVTISLSSGYSAGKTLGERRLDIATFVQTTLSRTVASMNTPLARQEAERRYAAMLALLNTWQEEELVYNTEIANFSAGR